MTVEILSATHARQPFPLTVERRLEVDAFAQAAAHLAGRENGGCRPMADAAAHSGGRRTPKTSRGNRVREGESQLKWYQPIGIPCGGQSRFGRAYRLKRVAHIFFDLLLDLLPLVV